LVETRRTVRPVSIVIKRRTFLAAAGATIAAACVPSAGSTLSFGPPETTAIRIDPHEGCESWAWVVEDLLREEGFKDIQITEKFKVHNGGADIGATFGNDLATKIDAGLPFVAIAGTHTGCIQMWAQPGINTIRDLRGKRIDVYSTTAIEDMGYGMWVSYLADVGLSPSDVRFSVVTDPPMVGTHHEPVNQALQNFLAGRSDAILAFVEQGPALRANPNNPGHLIFDMAIDKPWSQYYCCLLVATRDYATANPWATKRATRAILRGIDIVTKDRKAAVDIAVKKGFATDASQMLAAIQPLNYGWREYDPAESLRYFALKLADAKLIKKTPAQIVAETDFSFFRQMQRELRA
jgi:NitT/TauT family transport system substrate-binding protein